VHDILVYRTYESLASNKNNILLWKVLLHGLLGGIYLEENQLKQNLQHWVVFSINDQEEAAAANIADSVWAECFAGLNTQNYGSALKAKNQQVSKSLIAKKGDSGPS
jgi:hypothetical protein